METGVHDIHVASHDEQKRHQRTRWHRIIGDSRGAIATLLTLSLTTAEAAAQQQDIAPELVARMAQEKQARRACKVEICTAFAKPAAGAPITCDVTQTWTQQEIVARIVGGSYVLGDGHVQCRVMFS